MALPSTDELKELRELVTPGPWYAVEDDWDEIIIGNEEGHSMWWGDQVRFKFEAGDQKHDPALVALAPELLDEVIRLRVALIRLQMGMRHQPHQYLANEVANAIRIILEGDPTPNGRKEHEA